MFLAALVLLALAEAYRRARHRIRAVRPRLAPDARALRGEVDAWLRGVAGWEWALLAVLTVLGAALRVGELTQPIRYDEAATWLDYASRPLADGLADYRFPNNHLFHTLLVHVSAALFGDGPVALRIPALVAGVLLIPLTWTLARAMHSPTAAPIAGALTATSADLVLYSTNARGYTIVACATVALALLAVRQLRRDGAAGWLLVAVVAAMGTWTIPTMLYPLLGVMLWLWAEARAGDASIDPRAMRGRVGWTAAAAGALTALFYLPVIARSGIGLVVGNRFVRPQSRASFFAALPGFYAELWADWTRGWPVSLAVLLALGAVVALLVPSRAGRHRIPLLGAALAAATLLLVANGRVPYLRVWMYLLPLAFSAAGGGLAWLASELGRLLRVRAAGTIAALAIALRVGGLGTQGLLSSDVVRRADDTGTLRDGAAIAALIAREAGPRDHVVATAPADVPLRYQLARLHLAHDPLRATPDSAPRLWVVVDDDAGQDVTTLLRAAEVMTIDFAPPRLAARFAESRLFVMQRTRPGCALAPALCR